MSVLHTYENSHHDDTKKTYFYFTSYINLSGVFHTHSWVSNNRTFAIICFVLKFSLYNACLRPCDFQFYLLFPPRTPHVCFILRNHLILNKKEALFEFFVDKKHWKHSTCNKSLFILMFLTWFTWGVSPPTYALSPNFFKPQGFSPVPVFAIPQNNGGWKKL